MLGSIHMVQGIVGDIIDHISYQEEWPESWIENPVLDYKYLQERMITDS